MYARIKALFDDGRLTAEQVQAAVSRGWITEAQALEIIQ